MADLDERMRALDETRSPDLWKRIVGWEPGPARDRTPRTASRIAVAVAALALTAGAIAFAAVSFRSASPAATPKPSVASPDGHQTTRSVIVRHGTIRCSATFPSTSVAPGDRTGVVFSVTNISSEPQTIPTGVNGTNGWLRIRDMSGRLVADSIRMHDGIFGPIAFGTKVRPGESIRIGKWDPFVTWPGPLTVVPRCFQSSMPPVLVNVVAPGAAPSPSAAIQRVNDAIGIPVARCRPVEPDVPVTGTVPGHSGDFPARCEATVDRFPGFDIVVVGIVSPPDAPPVDIRSVANEMGVSPGMDQRGPATLTWWRYAVTQSDTRRIGRRSTVGWRCGGSSYFSGGSPGPCVPNH